MIKRFTLRKKVTFILLSIISVVILIFGIYLFVNFKGIRLNSFFGHKNNLANITLSNIIPGIEFDQKDYIKDIFSSLERDKEFSFSIIYDREGKRLIQHIRGGVPIDLPEKRGKIGAGERFLIIERDIVAEPQGKLGTLILGFDMEQVNNEINTILSKFAVFLLLLSVVFIVTLYIIMEKIIIRPIKTLTRVTENIADGDLSARVSISKRDELGNLAANFNSMAENLFRSFDTLEKNKNEILELQLFLESIIENSPNGVITVDHEGRITKINKSAVGLLGLKNVDFESRVLYEIDKNLSRYKKPIAEALDKNKVLRFDREQLKTNYGEKVFDILIYPISYQDDIGVVILLVDRSEQVSLEKQLIQSQKMEAIGTLAGGIAHDFNNILTIIMGYISILKLKAKDKEVITKINLIDDAAQRAADLVKQILVLSRKESGKLEQIDLVKVVDSVLKIAKEFFPRSIKIEMKYEGESFPIYGDKNLLSQVIINILINARDAIETSGNRDAGHISISLKNIFFDPNVKKSYKNVVSSNFAELRITDNGCGIEQNFIENIFDPFYTTKPKGKGTGLGLSIVYSILKNHDGEIKVYSERDKGSSFTITLPLRKEREAKKEVRKQKLYHGKGNVVIVDDETDVLHTAKEMLELLGYTVTCFNNGFDAFRYFEENHDSVNLILLDIMMPQIDGIKTYLHLREISESFPVIFCSGYAENRLMKELKKEYKNIYFLLKPFNIYELSRTVHDVLTGKGDDHPIPGRE